MAMNMVTKVRVDHRALLAMSRQDAIAYYMRETGATEQEAISLVSSTHPVFKDAVMPAVSRQQERVSAPASEKRAAGLRR